MTDRIGDLRYSVSPTGRCHNSLVRHFAANNRVVAANGKVSITAKDTLYSDTSYYQTSQDLSKYPYWIWGIRSNDGTFDDPVFRAMHAVGLQGLNVFGTVEHP